MTETYHRLISTLDRARAHYRVIRHPPAGNTEHASAVRGHPLDQAAKCLVVRVGIGKRSRRYTLAVVPGDRQVDLERLSGLMGGTRAAFARTDIAERLTGSVSGSIIPFSFDPELALVVDGSVLGTAEMYFNAARLDTSVALATQDYPAIARPRIADIAAPACGRPAAPRRPAGYPTEPTHG
jgi:Ala-tRNA(Pro) deacylase